MAHSLPRTTAVVILDARQHSLRGHGPVRDANGVSHTSPGQGRRGRRPGFIPHKPFRALKARFRRDEAGRWPATESNRTRTQGVALGWYEPGPWPEGAGPQEIPSVDLGRFGWICLFSRPDRGSFETPWRYSGAREAPIRSKSLMLQKADKPGLLWPNRLISSVLAMPPQIRPWPASVSSLPGNVLQLPAAGVGGAQGQVKPPQSAYNASTKRVAWEAVGITRLVQGHPKASIKLLQSSYKGFPSGLPTGVQAGLPQGLPHRGRGMGEDGGWRIEDGGRGARGRGIEV